MDKNLVGRVVHFYDKIEVAIVKLEKNLKVGDRLKFVKGDNSFEQEVSSMQVEHEQIENAKKGQEVGIKINKKAPEGTMVYLA